MNKQVIYNPNFIETIYTLAAISDDKIVLCRELDEKTNKEVVSIRVRTDSIIYTLKAPIEYFNFYADSIAFFEFSKFHKVYRFSVTTDENKELVAPVILAKINDDENSMTNGEVSHLIIKSSINGNTRTINHRISEVDTIGKPTFRNVKFQNDTNCFFELSKDNLDTLKKMCTLNNSDEIVFSGEGDNLKIDFYSTKIMDTMTEMYKTNCNSSPFSLKVFADGIQKIPSGDYHTEYMNETLIKFAQKRDDDIELNIYLPRKKV